MSIETEALLSAVKARRPVLSRVLDQYGDLTLGEYVRTFPQNHIQSIQPRSEVAAVASRYAERLLGKQTAAVLNDRLNRSPVLLTANHHGPDFLPVTIQGDILCALSEDPTSVLPVFAFGDVPLNNATYGRGIALSSGARVNIFPVKDIASLVSVARPLTEEMVRQALQRTRDFVKEGKVSRKEAAVLEQILQEDYGSAEVLGEKTFSDQSVVINKRLWARLFTEEAKSQYPDIAYLEMEKIVITLLENDLSDADSLMSRVLFDANLRRTVIASLDAQYGCWSLERLNKLLDKNIKGDERREVMQGAGTAFFWGLDQKSRRIPYTLAEEKDQVVLKGVDDNGNESIFSFDSKSIINALRTGQLLPSLFTSFATVAFARGYKCYGGFMQTDYLTVMKVGLQKSLMEQDYQDWADKVATVPTENYSTGVTFAVVRYGDGSIKPAGTVELLCGGGLHSQTLERIAAVTLTEANLLGLPFMYPAIYRQNERQTDLLAITAEDIYNSTLKGKLVEVNL